MTALAELFRNVIRQNRNLKIFGLGEKIARNYLAGYMNEDAFDPRKDGELNLIRLSKEFFKDKDIIVFDIGSHHGDWAVLLKYTLPNSVCHCFEIVPQTFGVLSERISSYKELVLNNIGLSDSKKEIQITYFPNQDSGSSIQPLPWKLETMTVTCQVMSGDQYCKERNIVEIDFMKIDVEGHELSVLKGFSELLKASKITLVQFEYGLTFIPPRVTLGDVYNLLVPYGYRIGRLYPTGVEFKQYDMLRDEHFRMGNYVAVHQSADRLLQQIKL